MIRKIIQIDENKCNGCGACAAACHEGAIEMIGGKAKLVRDDYCDGLGDCLPSCPTGAISFVEREAADYNGDEVKKNLQRRQSAGFDRLTPDGRQNDFHGHSHGQGCPGHKLRTFNRNAEKSDGVKSALPTEAVPSRLAQWPVQIKLVPVNAPYFDGAKLLVAADCTAFAYGNFHEEFIKNHITLIGCPKLDDTDYSEKLCEIIKTNDIKQLTVVRMEVPCCGAIEQMAKRALKESGKFIPWRVVTISLDGKIVE